MTCAVCQKWEVVPYNGQILGEDGWEAVRSMVRTGYSASVEQIVDSMANTDYDKYCVRPSQFVGNVEIHDVMFGRVVE